MSAKRESDQEVTSPYVAALEAALGELAHVRNDVAASRTALEQHKEKAAELEDLVSRLLNQLGPHERSRYVEAHDIKVEKNNLPNRSSDVFENVVQLFDRNSKDTWSPSEVIEALNEEGTETNSKAVYNVLNYLARKGRLKRIRRGEYLVLDTGLSVRTSDELIKNQGDRNELED